MGCLQDGPRVRGAVVQRGAGQAEGLLQWPCMVAVLP